MPVENNQYQTIFYQGILCAQTQLTKYIGARTMHATSGQTMACKGFRQLKPIDVLINPFIGKEVNDIDTHPFARTLSYLNPINWLSAGIAKYANWCQGIQIDDPQENKMPKENVRIYGIKISQISIGQETDLESHYEKYQLWKQTHPNSNLILWGVSRGAATTFNAMAKYKYPEVKLVVLEGCFNTLDDVLKNRYLSPFTSLCRFGLKLLTCYRDDGPMPAKSVADFPAHVPVVFVTSKKDCFVPTHSSVQLAKSLAARQQNDVYLLQLADAGHPNYMFATQTDRDHYETFIHAIYQKYQMPYDEELAQKGRALIAEATLHEKTHRVLS